MTTAKLIQDRKSARRRLSVSSRDCNRARIEISWLPSEAETIECHPVVIGDAVPPQGAWSHLKERGSRTSGPHPHAPMQPFLKQTNYARAAQAGSFAHGTSKSTPRRYLNEVARRLHCRPPLSLAECTEAEDALALPQGSAPRTAARLARAALDRVVAEADVHALGLVWNER
jgi:hypothetical protein